MAFWLASPVIDPSMFVLTSGLLGLEFAVAKKMAAIGLGLFGGYITYLLATTGYLSNPLRSDVGDGGCGPSAVHRSGQVVWRFWQDAPRRAKFAREAFSTAVFLLKWLSLAFLLESLMLAYVPAEWITSTLGGEGVAPILTATFVGVPPYLNGYAAYRWLGRARYGTGYGSCLPCGRRCDIATCRNCSVCAGNTSDPACRHISVWRLGSTMSASR